MLELEKFEYPQGRVFEKFGSWNLFLGESGCGKGNTLLALQKRNWATNPRSMEGSESSFFSKDLLSLFFTQKSFTLSRLKQKGFRLTEFNTPFLTELESLMGGKPVYNAKRDYFTFQSKGGGDFPLVEISDGFHNLCVLYLALHSGSVNVGTDLLLQNIEGSMSPVLISKYLAILDKLSAAGVRIFASTNSYFVLKNLYLIAQKNKKSVMVYQLGDARYSDFDMLGGMCDTSIIDEAIRLYEEDVELAFKGL